MLIGAPGLLDLRECDHALGQRALGGRIDQDHVLQAWDLASHRKHALQVLALRHRDPRTGVGDHELDLAGSEGLIDRKRSRAEHDRRQVDDVELRTVGEHDRKRLPPPQPQLVQSAGDVASALAPLRPGERLRIVPGADRDAIAKHRTGDLERLAERRRSHRA